MDTKQKGQVLKNKAQEFKGKVNEAVENTYPNDFKFIRTILSDSILIGIEAKLYQIRNVEYQLNFIQEQTQILQTTVETQYQIVKEQYKQYIEIANEQYSQKEKELMKESCFSFSYYNNIVNERLKWVQSQYQQNLLSPQNNIKDFQNHCQFTFRQLLNQEIQGQQKINLQTFNKEAKTAFNYADQKYQALQKKYKQAQVDWPKIQQIIFVRLYKGWQQGMNNNQIDEIINLKDLEYKIQWVKELGLLKKQSEELKMNVKEVVYQKYSKDFEFIRKQLIEKILNDIEIVLTGNKNPQEKLNQIQQYLTSLQQTVEKEYQIIRDIQKKNIDIAIQTYRDEESNILSQKFLEFAFYKNRVAQHLNQMIREYYLRVNPIQLERDQIKKHCQSVFEELFYGPIQGPNNMNFKAFKAYSENAYEYVTRKFDSLKQRLVENTSIKWVEEEKMALTKLYQGWQQGMDDNQIDELIDLKSYEILIPKGKEVYVPEEKQEIVKAIPEEKQEIVKAIPEEKQEIVKAIPEEKPEIVKAAPEELKTKVQEFISANYTQDFKFIRMQLISNILKNMQQAPDFLNQLQNNMQQTVQEQYQIIFQQFKFFIDAAIEIYNTNKNSIVEQPCYWFVHYNAVNQRLAWSYVQYIEQVQLSPQPDQFKSQCQEVFNKLFYEPIEGQPKINLQEFNKNVSPALTYVSEKFNSLQQKIKDAYKDEANLVNWAQRQSSVYAKLYQGWKPKMQEYEIDALLELKNQEQQIKLEIKLIQTVNAFIQLGAQNSHFYLFDEEYQMINQNAKIQEVQRSSSSSTPDRFFSQFYQDIIATLEHNEQVETLKKDLIEGMIALNLIPMEFTQNAYFKGQVIHLYFNYLRNLALQNFRKCSFWDFKNQYHQDQDLTNFLLGSLPRDPEQIKNLTQPIQEEYNALLENIVKKFKNVINSEEEYQQVIDESDPKFQEIVHPSNSFGLDEDQELYLAKEIDKFQKVKFLQWLNESWNLCKEDLKKYQKIQEEQLMEEFNRLKVEIEESIQNRIQQLNMGELLEDQFKETWCENKWEERINDIFHYFKEQNRENPNFQLDSENNGILCNISEQKQTEMIDIAFTVYIENLNKLVQQQCYRFAYYKNVVDQRLNWAQAQYISKIEHTLSQDQFKNKCQETFNSMIFGQIDDLQTLDLEMFNSLTKNASDYATFKYKSWKQKFKLQYKINAASVNWRLIKNETFDRLYIGWKQGMQYNEIDELLNLKGQEQQIHSQIKFSQIANVFITMASKEGHNYLFDEEINQNSKIREIQKQPSSPDQLAQEFYSQILEKFQTDQEIELMKKQLIDKINDIVPKEFTKNSYFNGQAIQLLLNEIRNSILLIKGNCSYHELKDLYKSKGELTQMFQEKISSDLENIQSLLRIIRQEFDETLNSIRIMFKKYIDTDQQYMQVIDEQDPLFLEIIHPSKSQDLDQEQREYLEKQIIKFQKVKFHQWLGIRFKDFNEKMKSIQQIDEEKLNISFLTFSSELEQSFTNKIHIKRLEGKTLLDSFRNQWITEWDPKLLQAFTEIIDQ